MVTAAAAGVSATELEVTHWWTSGGEAAAVKVFADAFNAGGDTWVDSAIAGSGGVARPVIISRILGGDPMGATQLNHGRQAEELVEAELMLDLTDLADEEGWRDIVRPTKLLDSCTLDGRIYCVPVNIHSWQWMWVSLKAYQEAGIDAPANWEEFVGSADALREKGVIPLAIGNQPWQATGAFGVVVVALGGKDLWTNVYAEKDMDAVRSDEMAAIWKAFGEARSLKDPNNGIQNWNDATNQVITGKAGAQIMGDWAQGEFSLAGYTAGEEYDCLPGLGMAPVLDTGGDAFYFPKVDDPEITAAQKRLASMMLSKAVQVDFNLAKGSLPVRDDIDLSAANLCMQKGLEILSNADNILPSGTQVLTPDTDGQLNDLIVEFFADSSMSSEGAHELFIDIMEQAE